MRGALQVLALGAYFRTLEGAPPDFVARVWFHDCFIGGAARGLPAASTRAPISQPRGSAVSRGCDLHGRFYPHSGAAPTATPGVLAGGEERSGTIPTERAWRGRHPTPFRDLR